MNIKNYKIAIISPLICLLIFLVLFLLFDLNLTVFYLGLSLSLVYIIFSLVYIYVFRGKETNAIQELRDENKELRELLEKANQKQSDLEEYFLMWVHQIKAPITAGNLLLEDDFTEKKEELKDQFLRIENYTSMAMNYIKITSPDRDMDFATVSLDSIITPLIQKYSMQFIVKNIQLHYEKIEEQILTDAKLLSIVVEQILNNALKYTKEGDIWVTYDNERNHLLIKDTGIGILSENIEKIFDKGYSGFNGRLNEKSSGIGLYLAKEIAKRLHHKISVTSEIHKGTEFTIEFSRSNLTML